MDEKLDKLLIEDKELFPPRARSINTLYQELIEDEDLSDSDDEKEAHDGRSLSQKVVLMRKYRDQDSQGDFPTYFLKKHGSNPRLAELEAYCGEICRFLSTSRYVPNTRPYVNNNGQITHVSSKAIPDFHSNYENPLHPNNLLINSSIIDSEYKKRSATIFTANLLEYYNRRNTPAARLRRYASLNFTSSLFDTSPTQSSTRTFLLQHIRDPEQFDARAVAIELEKRRNHITFHLPNTSDLQEERYHLNQVIRILDAFNSIAPVHQPIPLSVETLEKLDKQVRTKGIDLKRYNEFHDGKINEVIDGVHYSVRIQDLINYRILRGLGTSLTTRYIFKEADGHNTDMSKEGVILDFDWTKSNILYDFRSNDVFNQLFRHPDSTDFSCTEYNIEHFPDIDEPGLFYWPTKQPDLRNILLTHLSQFLSIIEQQAVESNSIFSIVPAQVLLDAFNLVEEHYLPNRNKTYTERVSTFFHGAYLHLSGIVTDQPVEELIVKEKIKHLFTNLVDKVSQLADQAYMGITPWDVRRIGPHLYILDKIITDVLNHYQELRDEIKIFTQGALFKIVTRVNPITEKDVEKALRKSDVFIQNLKIEIDLFRETFYKKYQHFERNSFTLEDNLNYKLLPGHPVFIFHKYKTVLKYVLIDPEVYRVFAELNIAQASYSSPVASSSSYEHPDTLHDRLVTDECKRTQEIRASLVTMPDFKGFLKEHGQFAFELVKEEFQEERERYSQKTKHKSYYERLVTALDLGEIEMKFQELYETCMVEEEASDDDLLLSLRI